MDQNFQENLKTYADVAIKIGLNLQPGQKLILQDMRRSGVPIQTAPVVRELTASAYQAGAKLVDVLWGDADLRLIRYKYAPKESFDDFPSWQVQGVMDVIKDGGAVLTIVAFDPSLLEGQDPDLVAREQKTIQQAVNPFITEINNNKMNWIVLGVPVDSWAKKVFPDLPEGEQMPALWDALFKVCRIYEEDPIKAWQEHIADLDKRSTFLNKKAYKELHYSAPGTDLHIVLPEGHIWRSAGFKAQNGIPFTANIPTEEVFTLPDKQYTEGKVSSSRPLAYSGNVIDNFNLTFKEGKVVDFSAEKGEEVLGNLLKSDEGASMLGEVALVPNSSPISQSGLMFYNTLLDENASCHLALGRAYRFSLEGGESLSPEEFSSCGGNSSLVHVDFMIGSDELDIDGVLPDGKSEPVMRKGEWDF